MTSRFLAKVLYTAQKDNGDFKRKIEQLVFEALTYTDCEAAVYKYMESVTRAEFTIMKIDRFAIDGFQSIIENWNSDSHYFLIKGEMIGVDGNEIKEKLLIQSDSMEAAKKAAEKDTQDYTIKSIVETKITDYIYAEADED
jgi:hypothetical protein